MRILVMYDLPQKNYEDNREYLKFRTFLLKSGFRLYQYSIYIRECVNDTEAKKHINRIEKNPPKEGEVSIIKITEKQFQDIIYIKGKIKTNNYNEKTIIIE